MINWGLAGGGNNALGMFQLGAQLGGQLRERQDAKRSRNALMGVIGMGVPGSKTGDGSDIPGYIPGAVGGGIGGQVAIDRAGGNEPNWSDLQGRDLDTALRFQQQQQSQARQQQEQRRADLPLIGRLLDGIGDEATYQQRKALAGQYGIDTSQLPQTFDPAWVEQQRATIQLLSDPAKQEALSTAGKQAVDMGYKPGTPEFNAIVRDIFTADNAKPYVVGGETRLYQPKIGGPGQVVGGPAPGTVEDGYRFKGGNPADPSSWEPVEQGGGGARVTSGFLDGL